MECPEDIGGEGRIYLELHLFSFKLTMWVFSLDIEYYFIAYYSFRQHNVYICLYNMWTTNIRCLSMNTTIVLLILAKSLKLGLIGIQIWSWLIVPLNLLGNWHTKVNGFKPHVCSGKQKSLSGFTTPALFL